MKFAREKALGLMLEWAAAYKRYDGAQGYASLTREAAPDFVRTSEALDVTFSIDAMNAMSACERIIDAIQATDDADTLRSLRGAYDHAVEAAARALYAACRASVEGAIAASTDEAAE